MGTVAGFIAITLRVHTDWRRQGYVCGYQPEQLDVTSSRTDTPGLFDVSKVAGRIHID